MATTFTQHEVKDREWAAKLNNNWAQVPKYLGEFATAPAAGTNPEGSTYYNTTDSYLYFLNSSSTWVKAAP